MFRSLKSTISSCDPDIYTTGINFSIGRPDTELWYSFQANKDGNPHKKRRTPIKIEGDCRKRRCPQVSSCKYPYPRSTNRLIFCQLIRHSSGRFVRRCDIVELYRIYGRLCSVPSCLPIWRGSINLLFDGELFTTFMGPLDDSIKLICDGLLSITWKWWSGHFLYLNKVCGVSLYHYWYKAGHPTPSSSANAQILSICGFVVFVSPWSFIVDESYELLPW